VATRADASASMVFWALEEIAQRNVSHKKFDQDINRKCYKIWTYKGIKKINQSAISYTYMHLLNYSAFYFAVIRINPMVPIFITFREKVSTTE